jgi:hypothetical protein
MNVRSCLNFDSVRHVLFSLRCGIPGSAQSIQVGFQCPHSSYSCTLLQGFELLMEYATCEKRSSKKAVAKAARFSAHFTRIITFPSGAKSNVPA